LKYFICALGKINIGIPAQQTERIIQVAQTQDSVYETNFISLPELLRQKDSATPHGIILKCSAGETVPEKAAKTVLLTPRIDAELEIPEENIYSLPKAMHGLYRHFRGAYCTDRNVILILAPEKLIENTL